jgi:hypothetical protein
MGNNTAAIRKRNAARKSRMRGLGPDDLLEVTESPMKGAAATQEFAETTQLNKDMLKGRSMPIGQLSGSARDTAQRAARTAKDPATKTHLKNAGNSFHSASEAANKDLWGLVATSAVQAGSHAGKAAKSATKAVVKEQARSLQGAARVITRRAKKRDK